jgi:hypothetical protein
MLSLLLTLAIYNALVPTGASAPQCAIKAQPRQSLSPLRDAVVTVTVEPQATPEMLWRKAEVCLFDGELRVRCSTVFEGDSAIHAPRTSRVEWKALGLAGGEYQVVLQVQSLTQVCRATDRLIVQGEQE